MRNSSRTSSVMAASPKAVTTSSYRLKVYRPSTSSSPSYRAARPTFCPPPVLLITVEASYWEYTPGRS